MPSNQTLGQHKHVLYNIYIYIYLLIYVIILIYFKRRFVSIKGCPLEVECIFQILPLVILENIPLSFDYPIKVDNFSVIEKLHKIARVYFHS